MSKKTGEKVGEGVSKLFGAGAGKPETVDDKSKDPATREPRRKVKAGQKNVGGRPPKYKNPVKVPEFFVEQEIKEALDTEAEDRSLTRTTLLQLILKERYK